jgi:hypothetical protein
VIQKKGWAVALKPPVPPIGAASRVVPRGAKAFSYNSRLRA